MSEARPLPAKAKPTPDADAQTGELEIRSGGDGSFSLWSACVQEGFHSGRGALREAQETFVRPSQLQRFPAGERLTLLEVCVGTGSNLAALIEACDRQDLELDWIGLELDPRPLRLALAQPAFRQQWQPRTVFTLEQLQQQGHWSGAAGGARGRGRILWGDARQSLADLAPARCGQLDLIWHDAFSPQRCPQLWTLEFLAELAALLQPRGRWLSYCSAAAVREALQRVPLHLVALHTPAPSGQAASGVEHAQRRSWSGGTLASRLPLEPSPLWRSLSRMEQEHQASSAGEPYRDPTGTATAAAIHRQRHNAQAAGLARGERTSSSAWRRRWGLQDRG